MLIRSYQAFNGFPKETKVSQTRNCSYDAVSTDVQSVMGSRRYKVWDAAVVRKGVTPRILPRCSLSQVVPLGWGMRMVALQRERPND